MSPFYPDSEPCYGTKNSVCLWQVQSLRKEKRGNGTGRYLEENIWFRNINQVQPTLFL